MMSQSYLILIAGVNLKLIMKTHFMECISFGAKNNK
ncbi:hypothetical protein Psal006b_01179 [Piscirickettsia salmonis]|nr:hypothetical protein Psal006b_01179 [Piscirickettsia salmonis]QGO12501.1 hypothetical protein Psal010b_01178 [Piscirickettsia salmonis]QGO83593.1 hypothetical protein Psal108_01174 [Piscirickettsia salmonis]QGO87109.1 hypothetical protein Psal109_01175 [Piscirickettsia salmonis]QGO90586.1 hypothetical protein Psal110_01168 [Piscirickettsia salmonis]